jgi:hypothetical protein
MGLLVIEKLSYSLVNSRSRNFEKIYFVWQGKMFFEIVFLVRRKDFKFGSVVNINSFLKPPTEQKIILVATVCSWTVLQAYYGCGGGDGPLYTTPRAGTECEVEARRCFLLHIS